MQISYSTISQYLICPKRVEFDLKGVKTPMTVPMALGSIFHYAINAVINGRGPRTAVLEAVAKIESGEPLTESPFRGESRWNGELVITPGDDRPRDLVSWLTHAVDLTATALGQGVVMEVPLKREMEGFTLVGVVDAFWKGLIIDFKLVGPRSRGGSKLQAACYALLSGGPTRFQYWLVRKRASPELERIDMPDTERQEFLDAALEHVIIPTAEAINRGSFPANPDHFLCQPRYCTYWKFCPFGGA